MTAPMTAVTAESTTDRTKASITSWVPSALMLPKVKAPDLDLNAPTITIIVGTRRNAAT